MNTHNLIITFIWSATLAFFGYLLVISLPLVAPSTNVEAVKVLVENGRVAIVSFFAFLGTAIGVLQALSTKTNGVESEQNVNTDETVTGPTLEKYKAKLHETYQAAKRLKDIAARNRHAAFKAMSYRVVVNITLQFALCHIACSGIQGLLQRAYPLETLNGTAFFLVAFAQTELLCICAAVIPCLQYRQLLSETAFSSKSKSSGTVFRVGGLGVFVAGVVSLVTLSPEQIATLLGNESLRSIPVLHVNYMAYLAFIRLILFPLIGSASCWMVIARHKS